MLTNADLETRLLDFVRGKLVEPGSTEAITRDTLLFEERVVDSLRILELIAFVQSAIGRKIPDAQIVHANFKSVGTIAGVFSADNPVTNVGTRARRPRPVRAAARRLSARSDFTGAPFSLAEDGTLHLGPTAARLFAYFDATVKSWAVALGAKEVSAPESIAMSTLDRAGYLEAFPDQLVAVRSGTGEPETCTARPPAVCYHTYPAFAESALPSDSTLITALGRCHRKESAAIAPSAERLRSFHMREIVALGCETFIETMRTTLMDRVCAWTRELGLQSRIERATDPFFVDSGRARMLMQRMLPLKYELRLPVGRNTGRSVAAASFNNHAQHFGRAFSIRLPSGEIATSGCTAFGWERWILAFVSEHGPDESQWPDIVRRKNATVTR